MQFQWQFPTVFFWRIKFTAQPCNIAKKENLLTLRHAQSYCFIYKSFLTYEDLLYQQHGMRLFIILFLFVFAGYDFTNQSAFITQRVSLWQGSCLYRCTGVPDI